MARFAQSALVRGRHVKITINTCSTSNSASNRLLLSRKCGTNRLEHLLRRNVPGETSAQYLTWRTERVDRDDGNKGDRGINVYSTRTWGECN